MCCDLLLLTRAETCVWAFRGGAERIRREGIPLIYNTRQNANNGWSRHAHNRFLSIILFL